MRTTIDIDPLVLTALKDRQKREGKTMGTLVSELLSRALSEDEPTPTPMDVFWPVKSMGALVDINDKEALWALLDEPTTTDDVRDR